MVHVRYYTGGSASTRLCFFTSLQRLFSFTLHTMAPRASKASQPRLRTQNDSPYVQANILNDASVIALADQLRAKRPALRSRSSLLKKLPFNYAAIYEEPALSEWLQSHLSSSDGEPDFLLVSAFSACHRIVFDASVVRSSRSTWIGGNGPEYIKRCSRVKIVRS